MPEANTSVESLVETLIGQLGGVRKSVDPRPLRAFFEQKDHVRLIAMIQESFGLDMSLELGRVRKGGPPTAPAWISYPQKMPPYGSRQFRALTIRLYIRNDFLAEATFEQFVRCVAHELAHIVLEATGSILRKDERAVDIASMILGYADFAIKGSQGTSVRSETLSAKKKSWLEQRLCWLFGSQEETCVVIRIFHFGYLTIEEISRVLKILKRKSDV